MPIYEYRCDGCGKETEILQKMDDDLVPLCNKEGCPKRSTRMNRKVSRTTFELRGSGWAKDGYGG